MKNWPLDLNLLLLLSLPKKIWALAAVRVIVEYPPKTLITDDNIIANDSYCCR